LQTDGIAAREANPTGGPIALHMAARASGANALAAQAVEISAPPVNKASTLVMNTLVMNKVRETSKTVAMDAARTLDALPRPRVTGDQPSLFGTEMQPKIVPFDRAAKQTVQTPATIPQPPRAAGRTVARRPRVVDEAQATLDFVQPTAPVSKTLKTSAEAVIYCDAVAAAPIHRSAAAALDAAMMLLGFGIILGIFQFVGKPTEMNRNAFLMLGGMMVLTAMFYSLLFAIAGALTPGLRWTELRLINFDGFPPDGRARALRLMGGWISILSGGLGLVWALLDEEGLTWHDHMSKTFPTLRESTSIVVRHGTR
jgi:uncharacterized RDD family membrane protein YckC